MSCEAEVGWTLHTIREQIAENELCWTNYVALPINEEAKERPVVCGNGVILKIHKMKNKVAMISEVMPRLIERHLANNYIFFHLTCLNYAISNQS